ncbi:hypothetical protein SteCoe_16237 [Stentor coeruleus]|uniref:Myb-like DNA-binding domain containing protein n=1 Tax=Stentor coeruleus TaxID=5963 RepID=A0A1R2C1V6_9CILI|nr:hypothetical protein SteCoe_16237 [Stentor coeruleus]
MENKPHPYAVTDDIWMVPCHSNKEGNQFQPLCQPFNSEVSWEELQVRHPWLPKEDNTLKKITVERGTKAWAAIARELNNLVHNGVPIRRGKQCRERYYNHLNTGLKKGNWAKEEDQYIIDMQNQIGNKWSEIAKGLPGRTENQVKNRWKSLLKKMTKKPEIKLNLIESDEFKMISPMIPTPSSTIGFVPYNYDLGFSTLADSIKTQYRVLDNPFKKEKTPSPSTLLYFNPE